MKFKINIHDIKAKELIAAEGSLSKTFSIMQRFMVDEAGNLIPEDKAAEILGDLPLDEMIEVQEEFVNSILPNLRKGARS